jgi:hypothetical protein
VFTCIFDRRRALLKMLPARFQLEAAPRVAAPASASSAPPAAALVAAAAFAAGASPAEAALALYAPGSSRAVALAARQGASNVEEQHGSYPAWPAEIPLIQRPGFP